MTVTPVKVGTISDFSPQLGECVKVGSEQVAVFYLPTTEKKWFAISNLNPQNNRTVLSRGIVGEQEGIPYVACPLHKYRYSFVDGACLTDEQYSVKVYSVTIDGDDVLIG